MSKCLNCDKELVHVEGRRKKAYCNSKCKTQFWNKKQGKNYKPTHKLVPVDDWNKVEMALSKMKISQRNPDGSLYIDFDTLSGIIENKAQESESANLSTNDTNSEEKGSVGAENALEVYKNEPVQMKGESSIDFRLRRIEYFEKLNSKNK